MPITLPSIPAADFSDVCFTANTGRSHFQHRLAVSPIRPPKPEGGWPPGLMMRTKQPPCVHGIVENIDSQVVFLFTDQGSQYAGIGRQLYQTQPIFRLAIDRCDAILGKLLDRPLSSIPRWAEWLRAVRRNALCRACPAGGAIRLGRTVEVVGSCPFGCDRTWRGANTPPPASRASSPSKKPCNWPPLGPAWWPSLHDDGRMLAVMAGPCRVTEALGPYAADVALAAVNGPRQVVLSGHATAIESGGRPIAGRKHSQPRCSPSPMPSIPRRWRRQWTSFAGPCDKVSFRKPRIRMIAGLSGKRPLMMSLRPTTWCRHLCEPIQFADGIATLDEQGYRVFVEIGPQPRLLGLGRRCMRNWAGLWLPSLKPPHADRDVLLSSLAHLYVHGVKIDWAGFHRGFAGRRVVLPTYPFQRQRYLGTRRDTNQTRSEGRGPHSGYRQRPADRCRTNRAMLSRDRRRPRCDRRGERARGLRPRQFSCRRWPWACSCG